jgi:hypothetical protein
MTDRDTFERIDRLVREDIRLRRSGSVSPADIARLDEVEELIGRSWDELLPPTGIDDSHA